MTFRRHAAERLAAYLVVLFLALVLAFVTFQVLARPGPRPVNSAEAAAQHRFFGGSIYERFGNFLWHLVGHASLGRSYFTRASVTAPVLQSSRVTLSVVGGALLLALAIGVPLGLLWGRGRVVTAGARAFIYLAFGIVPIWLGLNLAYVISYRAHWTPVTGYCDAFSPPPQTSCGGEVDWAWHLVLPWITLGLGFAAMYAHTVRALASRAKRAIADAEPADRAVVAARMRRQGIVAMTKRLARDVGVAIGAAVFIELVFSLPGLGHTMLSGIYSYDYPTVEGALVAAVLVALTFDLVVNLAGAALEPEWRTR